ncbi:MAG: hypothetical protein ACYS80_16370 [Planctomycetota bacterium]|jgi:Na+-driven multidrug efflux pump
MEGIEKTLISFLVVTVSAIIAIIPVNVLEQEYPDISPEGILIVFVVFFILISILAHTVAQKIRGNE